MFEYDNGILVCKEHRTPAQKNMDDTFWCRKCSKEEMRECRGCIDYDPDGLCLLTGELESPRSHCDEFDTNQN